MVRIILAIVWLTIIVFAMLTPGDKFPEVDVFSLQDKLVHFLCFGGLSYLWCGVGVKSNVNEGFTKRIVINYLIFGVFAGIFLEFLQKFIPFRSFDYMDMIVNEIGGIIGLLAYFKIPLPTFGLH